MKIKVGDTIRINTYGFTKYPVLEMDLIMTVLEKDRYLCKTVVHKILKKEKSQITEGPKEMFNMFIGWHGTKLDDQEFAKALYGE